METVPTCALCERATAQLTIHHLTPRQQAKRQGRKVAPIPTTALCPACHRQLHATFSNAQLARELNSVEKLKSDPAMQRFLAWVRKQDPIKRIPVRR